MCLGVPGRLVDEFVENGLRMGKVEFGGLSRTVCLEHVPEVVPGDYVLVHVGFALSRVDADEAARILAILEELGGVEAELGDGS
jgi:hydrogenase expression/formation protein HypC